VSSPAHQLSVTLKRIPKLAIDWPRVGSRFVVTGCSGSTPDKAQEQLDVKYQFAMDSIAAIYGSASAVRGRKMSHQVWATTIDPGLRAEFAREPHSKQP
jgi:hypothetical protein